MKPNHPLLRILPAILLPLLAPLPATAQTAGWKVVAWNNLGMHCMDSDYSVFSILPPFNTIDAQVINPSGKRVTNTAGITLSYEAVADPDGSKTSTSVGRTNFWQYALPLYNASLAPDQGLGGFPMPGMANVPQPLSWISAQSEWEATGIPITPVNDNGRRQPYPMLRVSARSSAGALLASTDIVTPVSSEMDCRACHASGKGDAAKPAAGWVNDADPERDYRLNILSLHDQHRNNSSAYQTHLSAVGYNSGGLLATVSTDHKPVLCAACHASEALPGTGRAGVPPLTQSVHTHHAPVLSPANGVALDAITNRSACYQCHPGSVTGCLRGAMGAAVASDGSLAMQCQSCHGNMSAVGAATRTGWLNEPTCQQCHTGTATHNNGQIRYTNTFDTTGAPRVPVDATFATSANAPATGLSLFRFSAGHGGLACSACHGSTHAIFPSSHRNDNLRNISLQGHAGTLSECSACHTSGVPSTWNGGPHGMHPVADTNWIRDGHKAAVESQGVAACRTCHGTNDRGSVLSRTFGPRTITTTQFGTKTWFQGYQVSCYSCHLGSSSDDKNNNIPPVAANQSLAVTPNIPATLDLAATDSPTQTLTYRIVRQPANGTVGLAGKSALYIPHAGYNGPDFFTWAANDGQSDSNLAVVRVTVGDNGANRNTSGDGIPDLVKHALGLDPSFPSAGAISYHMDRQNDGTLRQRLHLNAPVLTPDCTISVESSTDLINWLALPAAQVTQTPGAIDATDPNAVDTTRKSFLRVRVKQ